MEQSPTTEQVRLIVAPHYKHYIFRGWRQFVVLFAIGAIHTISQKLFWWLMAATLVIAIYQTVLLRRKQKNLGTQPSGTPRLQCLGNPDELEPLRDLEPEFFEPFVVQSSPYQMPNGAKSMPVKRTAFCLGTIFVFVFIFSGAGFPIGWTYAFLSITFLAILFVTYHAIPTYHRVSPGQLEVLKSRLLRRDLVLKRRLPLDRATIICHCGGDVIIQVPGEDAERIFLTDFSQEEESEFIEKLFRAAISKHHAPELPTNELTS